MMGHLREPLQEQNHMPNSPHLNKCTCVWHHIPAVDHMTILRESVFCTKSTIVWHCTRLWPSRYRKPACRGTYSTRVQRRAFFSRQYQACSYCHVLRRSPWLVLMLHVQTIMLHAHTQVAPSSMERQQQHRLMKLVAHKGHSAETKRLDDTQATLNWLISCLQTIE